MAIIVYLWTVVVVIVWQLDFQLPVQSVPIVRSNPVNGEV